MKKIKVYLQYPWKVSDSQYYKNMIEYPPKEIIYLNLNKKQGIITNKKKLLFANLIKRTIRNFFEKLNFPISNSWKSPLTKRYDIIHCCHCLSKNIKIPWVADFESLWQMWISGKNTEIGRKKVLEILKRENCKKILAWTESCKEEIIKKFPEIKSKIEVITFAMPYPKFKKVKSKKITLLHISRYFYAKGGLHTLEAMDILTKRYSNVNGIFVSSVPKEILKEYKKNKKIKFYNLLPYDKIISDIYPQSDIFVNPGYCDTFGFPFVEALAFGLPIITVDGFARKEVIKDGKTGFIIKRPEEEKINDYFVRNIKGAIQKKMINKLVETISLLLKNNKLKERMSKNCMKEIKEGRFSIKERNKKLKRIYEEILK